MAICLRQIFKTYNLFLCVHTRNHQMNGLKYKITSFSVPVAKEMTWFEYPPTCNVNSRLDSKIIISSKNLVSKNVNFFLPPNDVIIDWKPQLKLNVGYLGLNNLTYFTKEYKTYIDRLHKDSSNKGKPDQEQILHIFNILNDDLPKLFIKPMNFKIYHPNIIFENNIRGTKTIGIFGYMREVALFKIIGYIKFTKLHFDILKITAHPEDGTVRVRWRIRGIPNYKALMAFSKFIFSFNPDELEGWYDGFSVFYIKSDGLIHKHTVDKMIPDNEEKISNIQNHLAAKWSFAIGILVKDSYPCEIFEDIQIMNGNIYKNLFPIQKKNSIYEETSFDLHFYFKYNRNTKPN